MDGVNRPFEIFRVSVPDGEYSRRADVIEKVHYDDTQSKLDALKYKADLYDEVWQKATLLGFMNVTMALEQAAALREELAEAQRVLSFSGNEADAHSTAALHTELEDTHERLTAAEQRNAELVTLLHSATVDYACCLEAGYDRITSLGGDCDSVEKMLSDNPNYARYTAAFAKPTELGASEEPHCLLCLDTKTVPGNVPGGFVKDCPDCCGEEG